MGFLIKYELASSSLEEETKDANEAIDLVQNLGWEKELALSDEKGVIPSVEIVDEVNERLLIASAMDMKECVLFTVESLRTGRKQRGETGTLINDLPHKDLVSVVEMFCRGDYSSIEQLDNAGFFSKLLRKITYLFAGDDWHK